MIYSDVQGLLYGRGLSILSARYFHDLLAHPIFPILRSGEKNVPFNVILLELQCSTLPPYLGEICLNPRHHMGTPQLHGCDAGNICQHRAQLGGDSPAGTIYHLC